MSKKEERIVAIQFDNNSFEKNVNSTLKSLDSLDKSINELNGSSGLTELSRNTVGAFSEIGSVTDQISVKFSGLSAVVAGMCFEIGKDILNLGKKIVGSTFGQIITGGTSRSLKIEQGKFLLGGLHMDVEQAMKAADYAVADTPFGLDAAVTAAAQLGAAGVAIKDSEDDIKNGTVAIDGMANSLMQISNIAAITGSEYESVTDILVKSAASGIAMNDTLRRLGQTGLPIYQYLANYYNEMFGTDEFTQDTIFDMASKRQISYVDMIASLTNELGTYAKEANATWSGSVANIQNALNKIGALFIDEYHKNFKPVVDGVRILLNDFRKAALDPLVKWFSNNLSRIAVPLTEFLTKITDFVNNNEDQMLEITNVFIGFLDGVVNGFFAVLQILKVIYDSFKEVFGEELISGVKALSKYVSGLFKEIDPNTLLFIKNVTNIIFRTISILFQVLKKVYSLVSPFIKDILLPVLSKIGNVIGVVVNKISYLFTELDENLKEPASKINEFFNNIKEQVENIVGAIKINFKDIYSSFVNFFSKVSSLIEEIKMSDTAGNILESFGNIIEKVGNVIQKTINTISPVIKSFFDAFLDFLGDFDLEKLINTGILAVFSSIHQQFLTSFGLLDNTIRPFFFNIKMFFQGLRRTLIEFQAGIKATSLMKISAAMLMMAGALLVISLIDQDKLSMAVVSLSVLAFVLTRLSGSINSLNKTKKFSFGQFFKSITKAVSLTITSLAIINFSIALMALAAVFKILSTIDAPGLIRAGAAIAFLAGIIVAMSYAVNPNKLNKISLGMIIFADTMLLLSASILILSKISPQQLGFATAVVAAVSGIIVGLSLAVKPKNLNKISRGMFVFAETMLLLSASITILSKISPQQLGFSTAVVAAVSGIIVGLSLAVKPKNLNKISRGMLVFSETMLLLSASVTILSKVSPQQLGFSTAFVAAASGIIVGLSHAVNPSKLNKIALGMTTFAGTMVTLSSSIRILSNIPVKSILAGGAAITAFSGILVGLSWAINPSSLNKAALGMLAFSQSFSMLITPMLAFSVVPWNSLKNGLIVMGVLTASIIALGAISAIVPGIEKAFIKLSVAMLSFAAGIELFSLAILNLSLLGASVKTVLNTIAEGFSGAIITFITSLRQNIDTVIEFIAYLITGIITKTLSTFHDYIRDLVPELIGIISELLDMLINNIGPIVNKVVDLIIKVIDLVIDRVPEIISKISKLIKAIIDAVKKELNSFGVNAGSFAAMLAVITGITASLVILGKMKKQIKDGIAVLIIELAALAAVAALLIVLSAFDTKKALEASIGMSATLVSVASAMYIVQNINPAQALSAAIGLVEAMGILIGAFLAIEVILGLLNKIEGFSDLLDAGAVLLGKIGNGIGQFVGGILAGMTVQMAGTLDAIGQGLEDFMGHFLVFIDGANQINEKTLEAIGILVAIILALTAAEFIKGITSFFGSIFGISSDYDLMSGSVLSFVDVLAEFCNRLGVLSEDDVNKALLASEVMKNLSIFVDNIPTSGGLKDLFAGEQDLEKFSDAVEAYAEMLPKVADLVRNLTEEDKAQMQLAADMGVAFAEFAKTIPNSGGVLGAIVGNNDLDDFGKKMLVYTRNLMQMVAMVRTYPLSDSDSAMFDILVGIGENFAEFAKTIPNSGGVLGAIVGNNDLDDFGKKMKAYAETLMFTANSLRKKGGFTMTDVMNFKLMAFVGEEYASFAKTIPNSGGFVQAIVGGPDLGVFSEQIDAYVRNILVTVRNLRKFGNVSQTDVESFRILSEIGKQFAILAENVPTKTTNVTSWLTGDVSLSKFANEIVKFSEEFRDYTPVDISDGNVTSLKNLAYMASSFANIIKGTTYDEIKNWINDGGLSNFGEEIVKFAGHFSDFTHIVTNDSINRLDSLFESVKQFCEVDFSGAIDFFTYYDSFVARVSNIKKDCIDMMINAFTQFKSAFTKAVKSFLEAGRREIDLAVPNFRQSGRDIVKNILDGIKDHGFSITESTVVLVNAIINSIESQELKTKLVKTGEFIVDGIVNGMYSAQWKLTKATSDIANSIPKEIRRTLEIKSPSRVMRDKVGKYIVSGIASGIEKYGNSALDSASNLSNELADYLRPTLSNIIDMINSDINQPVITPIMDLSQVQNGIGTINSSIPGQIGVTSRNITGRVGNIGYDTLATSYDDRNVIMAINRLNNRMDELSQSINNMQMVLDTGALVGGIADPMNNALNKISVRNQRGG